MSELPFGWVITVLGELLRTSLRNGHSAKESADPKGVRIITLTAVTVGDFSIRNTKVSSADPSRVADLWLEPGDLLIERSNTPELVGTTRLYTGPCRYAIYPDLVIRARLVKEVLPRFVELALQGRELRRYFQRRAKGMSGSMPKIDQQTISETPIPLPPLAEQKRIVEKIEELFSELEAGEGSLREARRQLGVYRQSLLKQAFEGQLTAKWRTQNPAHVSAPAVPAVTTDKELGTLEPLPAGWIWTHFSNVGELGRGKSKHRPRNDARLFGGSYPFIQTGEVRAASKTVKTYTETYSEFGLAQSKLWPKGTLCITIAANIAETAFLGFDACFPDSVVGFVPAIGTVNAEFIELFIRAVRSRIEKYAPATAQKNINLTTLENLVLPLCSLPEQQEIVRVMEEQFEVIEQNEREIDRALRQSAALRQSILKKAFTGKLVPQHPSDEPAADLLARVRTERVSNPARAKRRDHFSQAS